MEGNKRSIGHKRGKYGTLYVLEGQIEVGATLEVTNSTTKLWHKRLGHMSKKGLEILKNQLPGLKEIDMELCEHCIYG
jgi:hypothetical protein